MEATRLMEATLQYKSAFEETQQVQLYMLHSMFLLHFDVY